MCANCLTAMEATAIQSVGAAVVVQQGWHRLRDRVGGRHPSRRAQDVYDRNRVFVESLGLDAAAVLGARPVVAVADREPVRIGVPTRRSRTSVWVGAAPIHG
jgi:hypothetical protein